MIALIATAICVLGLGWFLLLDYRAGARLSPALWLPTIWLILNGSRTVTMWLKLHETQSLAETYTEGRPLDAAIYALLTLAGILVLNYRSQRTRTFIAKNPALILFFVYCAVSVLWSDYPQLSAKRWIKSMGDLVMVAVILTDRFPLNAMKRVLIRCGVFLLPLSVLFIKCYPSLGIEFDPDEVKVVYLGVTTFKNMLGMISMIFGLTALWALLGDYGDRFVTRRWTQMAISVVLIGSAYWLIVTADSMTPFGSLTLSGALLIAATRRVAVRSPKSIHVLMATTLCIPLFAIFLDTMGGLVRSVGRDTTLTGRTVIWKAVLLLHTNPLIGTGFESFWVGSRMEQIWNTSVHGIQEAHNGLLEVYLNLGLLGVAMLLMIILQGYKNAVAIYRRDPLAGAIRVAFLAMCMMYSLTEASFRMMSPVWFILLLMSAGGSSSTLTIKEENRQREAERNVPNPIRLNVLS